jgi:uncharacterized membrane protein (UPF0136 family)
MTTVCRKQVQLVLLYRNPAYFIATSHEKSVMDAGLEINLDVVPVIMTCGSLNLPVTAKFMPVIVTP